jgi:Bacteriocin-protection, YdeI or OmpD-Associated
MAVSLASRVPDDLKRALSANPRASKAFARLDKANRYSVLYRVTTARRPDTRARNRPEPGHRSLPRISLRCTDSAGQLRPTV